MLVTLICVCIYTYIMHFKRILILFSISTWRHRNHMVKFLTESIVLLGGARGWLAIFHLPSESREQQQSEIVLEHFMFTHSELLYSMRFCSLKATQCSQTVPVYDPRDPKTVPHLWTMCSQTVPHLWIKCSTHESKGVVSQLNHKIFYYSDCKIPKPTK